MDTSNVKESIDERILRLLGLEDVFDLDYDTYLTLLKEAMVKGRMPKTTIPTEEIEALTDEYKRVKGKKNKGRFEVKKGKKINSTSFNLGKTKGLIAGSKSVKALPAAIGTSPVAKSLDDNISAITAAVVSIHETIKQQQNLLSGSLETDRRRREKEKGDAAENKLEKRFEGLKKIAEKVIAPVKSILDKIINFLVNVLLGRVVIKLLDWLADPKNASKVKSVIRFIGDWWPALLGAYVLFGTTFGAFVRGTVGMLGRFIFQIGKVAIPQLLRLIKSPLGAGVALFTAGATIPAMFPGTVNEQERKTSKAPGSTKDKIQQLQTQKANLNVFEKLQGKGSEIDEQISLLQTGKTKGYGFSGGGFNGFVSGEKGVDKVPAMLSDGEFVMSRGAVAKYGVDTLETMNASGGGTNKPKLISGVPHAAGGGLIGDAYKGVDRASGGNLKPVVDEIIRGLSSQYKWANDLARKTGVKISGVGKRLQYEAGRMGNKMPSLNIGGHDIGKRLQYEASRMGNGVPSLNIGGHDIGKRLQYEAGRMGNKMPSLNIGGHDVGKRLQYEAGRIKGLPGKLASKFNSAKKDDMSNVLGGLGRSSYRDAGMVYARSMLGGIGGKLTEKDFSPENQKILEAAIKRAQSRQQQKLEIATKKLAEKPNDPARQSAVRRLQQGQIQLGYEDYASGTDKKGKPVYSEKEKDLKNILGQAWFQKQKGGGYRSTNEKYDFQKYKNPWKVALGMTDEENKDVKKSGVNFQKRLEALHQINPLARDLEADVMIGGTRPKAQIAKSKPVAKPVKPPAKPQAKVVYGPPVPSRLKGKKGSAPKSSVPNFTAGAPGMGSKTRTLGLMR